MHFHAFAQASIFLFRQRLVPIPEAGANRLSERQGEEGMEEAGEIRPRLRHPPRLTVARLMLLTALLAVGLAVARIDLVGAIVLTSGLLALVLLPRHEGETAGDRGAFLGLFVVAVGLEVAAARLAWETLGEIESALYLGLVLLNLVPLAVYLVGTTPVDSPARTRRLGRIGLALLFLLIVPYQAYLAWWAVRLEREAARVVGWVYEQRLNVGAYPAGLEGYPPRDVGAFRQIRYRPDPGSPREFVVSYSIGTRSTSHWYRPSSNWFYYPD